MDKKQEQNLLNHLEGEIKHHPDKQEVFINGKSFCAIANSFTYNPDEAGNFITQLLISERNKLMNKNSLIGICVSLSEEGENCLDIPDKEDIRNLLPCDTYLSGDFAEDGTELVWLVGSSKNERSYVHQKFLKITPKLVQN